MFEFDPKTAKVYEPEVTGFDPNTAKVFEPEPEPTEDKSLNYDPFKAITQSRQRENVLSLLKPPQTKGNGTLPTDTDKTNVLTQKREFKPTDTISVSESDKSVTPSRQWYEKPEAKAPELKEKPIHSAYEPQPFPELTKKADEISIAENKLNKLGEGLKKFKDSINLGDAKQVKLFNDSVGVYNQEFENYQKLVNDYNKNLGTIKSEAEGREKLSKSLEDFQNGTNIFGVPNVIQNIVEHEKKIKENPYLMTKDEANQFYEQNENLVQGMVTTTRRALNTLPVLREVSNTLLYHLRPDTYKYVVADELRDKTKTEEITNYINEYAADLAGIFALGGGIHRGINTLRAIETLAETSPKVAKAISSFTAGSTYEGINQSLLLSEGKTTPNTAIAQTVASGLVWTVFSQVGTKDWLKLQSKLTPTVIPEGTNLKGFVPKWKTALNGQNVDVGYLKDRGYLSRSIANWLVDAGVVTAVSNTTSKVIKAVNESEIKNIPLVKALQKEFSDVNLTELGIEYAINAIFTGSMPRQYGKMPPPPINKTEPIKEQKLLKGKEFSEEQRNVDNVVRESMKPEKGIGAEDSQKKFEVSPFETKPQENITFEGDIFGKQGISPEEAISNIKPFDAGRQEGLTQEDNLQTLFNKQMKRFEEIENRRQKKLDAKNDADTYSQLSARYYQSQRKKQIINEQKFAEISQNIPTPEVKAKAEALFAKVQEQNKRFVENNAFTLENLSKKIFKTKDINSLTDDQQKQLLFEFNEMKKQGIKEFGQIEEQNLNDLRDQIRTRKEEENAIRQQKKLNLLQSITPSFRPTTARTEQPFTAGRIEKNLPTTFTSETDSRIVDRAYSGGDIPFVQSNVIPLLNNNKVFDAIIRLVPIDMMNDLIGEDVSPKELLHNKSMFFDALTSDKNGEIGIRARASIVRALASFGAKLGGSPAGSNIELNSTLHTKELSPTDRDLFLSLYNSFSHNQKYKNELLKASESKEGVEDAIQKQKTTTLDVQEQTENGKGVGGRNKLQELTGGIPEGGEAENQGDITPEITEAQEEIEQPLPKAGEGKIGQEDLSSWYDDSKPHKTDTPQEIDAINRINKLREEYNSLPDYQQFGMDSPERANIILQQNKIGEEMTSLQRDLMKKRIDRIKQTPFYQEVQNAQKKLRDRITELRKMGGDMTGEWTSKMGIPKDEFIRLTDALAVLDNFGRGEIPTPKYIKSALETAKEAKPTPPPESKGVEKKPYEVEYRSKELKYPEHKVGDEFTIDNLKIKILDIGDKGYKFSIDGTTVKSRSPKGYFDDVWQISEIQRAFKENKKIPQNVIESMPDQHQKNLQQIKSEPPKVEKQPYEMSKQEWRELLNGVPLSTDEIADIIQAKAPQPIYEKFLQSLLGFAGESDLENARTMFDIEMKYLSNDDGYFYNQKNNRFEFLTKEAIKYAKAQKPHKYYVQQAINEGKITSHPDYPDLKPLGDKTSPVESKDNNKEASVNLFNNGKTTEEVATALNIPLAEAKKYRDEFVQDRAKNELKKVKEKPKEVSKTTVTQKGDEIHIQFPEMPSEETIAKLKTRSFRQSGKELIWRAKKTDKRLAFANEVKNEVEGIQKPKEEKLEVIEQKPDKKQSKDVEVFPIDKINLDTNRFQNREQLTEDKVENIVKNYNEKEFDPVHLWTDPKNNKTYLLSGHHRLEAAKRLGLKEVKSTMRNDLNEAGAIEYAQERSNANRLMETPAERAKIYRKQREQGLSENRIIQKAQEAEGKNSNRILNLSYLNPSGNTLTALKSVGENVSGGKVISEIADYIGEARRRYPQLTDSHENELFEWLYTNGQIDKFKNKLTFQDNIESYVSHASFDKNKPLGVGTNKVVRGSHTIEIDKQLDNLRKQRKELEKDRRDYENGNLPLPFGLTDKEFLNEFSKKIANADAEILKLTEDRREAVESDRNQDDLFSQITEEIPNERAEEIISSTDPAELEELAEDIEREEETSEDLSDEEIEEHIRSIDEVIKPQKPDTDLLKEEPSEYIAEQRKEFGVENALAEKVNTNTSEFKRWFGGSKVVDENGKPLVVYSGHGNTPLYGNYNPKRATAGGFYATENPDIASNYAMGKFGVYESFENGGQYRIKGKNGKYNKKLWQIELTDEQKKILDKLSEEQNELGENRFNLNEMMRWAKDSRDYEPLARRILYRGKYDLQSIFDYNEHMGYNIAYPKQPTEKSEPLFERQVKNDTEEIMTALGIDWQAYDWNQPGVFPLYLSIQNPIDASKPFPEDLLKALKDAAKYERTKPESSFSDQWTSDYPLKTWIADIESGSEYWTTQIPRRALPIVKRFGYDGIKELGNKGATKPEERQTNWIAFEPEQIKSVFNKGKFDPNNPDMLMEQRAQYGVTKILAEPFYSKLERVSQDKLPNVISNWEQVYNTLKNNGVKDAEIEWSGIEQFIKDKGKVTKADLLDFIKANKVEVEEVKKGGVENRNLKISRIPGESFLFNVVDEETGEIVKRSVSEQVASDYIDSYHEGMGDTKFSQWKTSGGENYSELLFTLPKDASESKRIEEIKQLVADKTKELRDINIDLPVDKKQWTPKHLEDIRKYNKLNEEIATLKNEKLILETSPKSFKSGHWDEPNVFAHTRVQDFTDAEGRKLLFVDEIQSDWGITARKEGIKDSEAAQRAKAFGKTVREIYKLKDDELIIGNDKVPQNVQLELSGLSIKKDSGVPDFPFKSSWHEFTLKRLLREAVENGYDGLAWVTGEMTAERYDLSKQVDYIRTVTPASEGQKYIEISTQDKLVTLAVDDNGKITNNTNHVLPGVVGKNISDVIGKDVAEKILKAESGTKLSGIDLKIGAEWTKNLYDRQIPNFFNSYTKKWGARVGETTIQNSAVETGSVDFEKAKMAFKSGAYVTRNSPTVKNIKIESIKEIEDAWVRGEKFYVHEVKPSKTHFLPITESMRKSITEEGQPLFETPTMYGRENADDLTKLRDYKKHLELSVAEIEKTYNDYEVNLINKLDYSQTRAVNDFKDRYNLYGDKKGVRLIDAKLELYKTNEAIKKLSKLAKKDIGLRGQQDMFGGEAKTLEPSDIVIGNKYLDKDGNEFRIAFASPKYKKLTAINTKTDHSITGTKEEFADRFVSISETAEELPEVEIKPDDLTLFEKQGRFARDEKQIEIIFGKDVEEIQNTIIEQIQNSQVTERGTEEGEPVADRRGQPIRYQPEREAGQEINKRSVPEKLRPFLKQFRDSGQIDFSGTKLVNPAQDLGDAFKIARNPFTETIWLIGVKDGVVVKNIGISSDASGYINITPEVRLNTLTELKDAGATEFYLTHNHPSGNPTPSNEDFAFATMIGKEGKKLGLEAKESIVINGDEFSHWEISTTPNKDGSYTAEPKRLTYKNPKTHPAEEFYKEFDKSHKVIIKSPTHSAQYFGKLKYGNGVVAVVVVASNNTVRGYEYVNAELVRDTEKLGKYIDEVTASHGGASVFIVGEKNDLGVSDFVSSQYYGTKPQPGLKEISTTYTSRPVISTIAYEDGRNIDVYQFKEKIKFKPGERVAEEITNYEAAKEDKNYVEVGRHHLENLKTEMGDKADIYPVWAKLMKKDFGEGIRRDLRTIWREAKNKIIEIGKTPAKETTFGMGLGQILPNIKSAAEGTNERSKQNLVDENYGLSRTLKQSGNAPILKTLGEGTSNLVKGISEEGKKFMDQFTTPPPVKAQLDKRFRPFYNLAERRLNREYVGNQNEILRVAVNDFKDFRKLSNANKEGLLEALEDYHHNYMYRGTFIATNMGIRGKTVDEIIEKYDLNSAQELVLRQFDELGQATLELVKKGEKEMLFEFKKDISGMFSKEEFIEVLPQFSKYEEYMDAPLNDKVMNDVWNNDPLSRMKLADFAVERKYQDYGKYFYMNLSRPLEQGNWVVHIEKPIDPRAKDPQIKRIFTYFENEADAKQFYQDAKKEGWTLKDRIARVNDLLKNQSDWGRLDQTTLLHLFNTSNIEIPKEVVDQLLKTVKEGYWEKHTIQRNYTPGLKWTAKETEQNIVNLLSESSAKRNKLYGIAKLNEMLTDLENEYGRKVREVGADENELAKLKRTMEYTQKFISGLKYANNNVLNSIRGIMYLWDLGFFRPSFMLQQTTENFQTVMPLAISEGGLSGESDFIKAGIDTGKIALAIIEEKLYGQPKIDIEPKLWNMITKLRDMEKVSPLGVKVLFGESGDPKIHYDNFGKTLDAIKNTLSAGGQGIEYITRIHTAATFYRIAKRKGMTDIDKITNYVADMIDLSKANYTKTGTIVALNARTQKGYNEKSVGRMLANAYLVYKKWASANTGLYRYLWNRSKVAFLTKVMVGIGAGGIKKFPMIIGLYGLASLLINLFNDDDSDLDYKVLELENKLNKEVGGKIGSLLNRGAGTYFNTDLSGLMSQGSALPTDVIAPKIGNIKSIPQALYEAPRIATESVMGRPYTFTTDIISGIWGGIQLAKNDLDEKDKQRASKKFITALPSTIRSFYQSDIMDTEGLKYRNKILIKPEDMTDEELLIKKWGFQPERFMKAYDELGKPKTSSRNTQSRQTQTRQTQTRQTQTQRTQQ